MKRFRWWLAGALVLLLAGTALAAVTWNASFTGTVVGSSTGTGMDIYNWYGNLDGFTALSPNVVMDGTFTATFDEGTTYVNGTWKGQLAVAYYSTVPQAVVSGDVELTVPGSPETVYKGEIGGHWIYNQTGDNFHGALRLHTGTGRNKTQYQGFAIGNVDGTGANVVTNFRFYLGTASVTP